MTTGHLFDCCLSQQKSPTVEIFWSIFSRNINPSIRENKYLKISTVGPFVAINNNQISVRSSKLRAKYFNRIRLIHIKGVPFSMHRFSNFGFFGNHLTQFKISGGGVTFWIFNFWLNVDTLGNHNNNRCCGCSYFNLHSPITWHFRWYVSPSYTNTHIYGMVSPRNMTESRLRHTYHRSSLFSLILAPWVFPSIKMDYHPVLHIKHAFFTIFWKTRFLLPIVNCE